MMASTHHGEYFVDLFVGGGELGVDGVDVLPGAVGAVGLEIFVDFFDNFIGLGH